jgi:hypothetical protein
MSAGFSNATVYLKCDSVVFAYYACAVKIVLSFFFENTILVYVSAHCAFSSLHCILCDFSYLVASS